MNAHQGKTSLVQWSSYKLFEFYIIPNANSTLLSTTYVLSDYTWTVKTDYTLTGYVNKTKYKTLALALAACAKSSKCNGVTKEGEY